MAMRFTTRRAMIAVAVIAVPLSIAVAIDREFRRMFPATPAEWAWARVARMEGGSIHHRYAFTPAKQYRELAIGFERTGEKWAERTSFGPFTDCLTAGESVVIRQATRIEPSDLEGRRLRHGESWPVARGTVMAVVMDWAPDADGCEEFRDILVRFVDGPHRGEIGCVGRIYMRRRL